MLSVMHTNSLRLHDFDESGKFGRCVVCLSPAFALFDITFAIWLLLSSISVCFEVCALTLFMYISHSNFLSLYRSLAASSHAYSCCE